MHLTSDAFDRLLGFASLCLTAQGSFYVFDFSPVLNAHGDGPFPIGGGTYHPYPNGKMEANVSFPMHTWSWSWYVARAAANGFVVRNMGVAREVVASIPALSDLLTESAPQMKSFSLLAFKVLSNS